MPFMSSSRYCSTSCTVMSHSFHIKSVIGGCKQQTTKKGQKQVVVIQAHTHNTCTYGVHLVNLTWKNAKKCDVKLMCKLLCITLVILSNDNISSRWNIKLGSLRNVLFLWGFFFFSIFKQQFSYWYTLTGYIKPVTVVDVKDWMTATSYVQWRTKTSDTAAGNQETSLGKHKVLIKYSKKKGLLVNRRQNSQTVYQHWFKLLVNY